MTMTMALLLPSLLPFFLILLSLIDHHHHNVAAALFVSAAEESSSSPTSPLRCLSGWTRSTTLQTIPPDKINDGYCDCPLDGLDEVETGACSGSMDGMWAGIPASSSGDNAVKKFVCPQQPSLQIPPSRINDGICDCCDGADEKQPQSLSSSHHHSQQQYYNPCPDVCDTMLAKERAAYQKLQQDYTLGSQLRTASIQQYQKWNEDMQIQIQKVSTQDIRILEEKIKDSKELLSKIRIDLVKMWTLAVDDVLGQPILDDIVNNPQVMDVQTLGLLIVSLCQLSGETSIDQVVVASNGRCVPFHRASLDMGILWDIMDHNNGENYDLLPSFHVFDAENEESIDSYAEKLILRLEGRDNRSDSFTRVAAAKSSSSSTSTNDRVKRSEPEPDEIDYDDFEEEHDFHYDDDYMGHSGDTINEQDIEDDNDDDDKKEGDDVEVKFLLENLPLLAVRDSFKEHGKALLAASSATDDKADTDEKEEEEGEDSVSEDEVSDNSSIDPMALNMARSTISKRLGNIARGETSSKSAARFVAALIGKSSSVLEDLQSLAIMTMYHSKLSSEDIAEIIYTLTFPPDQRQDGSEQTCSDVTPWSKWCPPVTIVSQNGGKPYPPPLIVAAAERRCSQRDNAVGVCSGKEGEEKEAEFPLSVPDGYYSYYEPQIRSPADELSPLFAAMDSLRIPEDLTSAKKEAGDLDKKLAATKRELTKLEAEVDSSDASKYGVDGELFTIRDTCHKIESGKYEYEVCIFGKATQRDIGQNSGGTHLGSWDKVLMENGQRTLRWNRGTKCWNGPVRSAEVIVTCGSATKILAADEPETCRYVFTMESPIACDEQFKVNNSL